MTLHLPGHQWPADGMITLRRCNDISSVKLDGSDAPLTYKVEGNDLVITLPAQPDEILPSSRSQRAQPCPPA